jgi:hypothetical protein
VHAELLDEELDDRRVIIDDEDLGCSATERS